MSGYYPQVPRCQIPNLSDLYEQFLGCKTDGYFVEIGAHDGLHVSNTWGLAERHWHGLFVEPVPQFAEECRRNYARHNNIRVFQMAVGSGNQTSVDIRVASGLSTASPELHEAYSKIPWSRDTLTDEVVTVLCTTLDSICESFSIPVDFDVLVVDVEGFESEVFRGFNYLHWRPKIMIVEICDTHPDLYKYSKCDALLTEQITISGWRIAYKDSINTVFVRYDIWDAAFADAVR